MFWQTWNWIYICNIHICIHNNTKNVEFRTMDKQMYHQFSYYSIPWNWYIAATIICIMQALHSHTAWKVNQWVNLFTKLRVSYVKHNPEKHFPLLCDLSVNIKRHEVLHHDCNFLMETCHLWIAVTDLRLGLDLSQESNSKLEWHSVECIPLPRLNSPLLYLLVDTSHINTP